MTETRALLAELIARPTVSRQPNIALIEGLERRLAAAGAETKVIAHEDGTRANLWATIGPRDTPGVALSGHTDVVSAEGQGWTRPPFELTEADGRLYGRGTADMKGFVAAAVAAALRAAGRDLKTPLHLALSYDEEIGCMGVRPMIEMLREAPIRPRIVIVGEPTSMGVATGHKGKTALRAVAHGREGHSALAPHALNALHLAVDFAQAIRARQARIAAEGRADEDYDLPYTTLHIGRIEGGDALNIVPGRAEIGFEIRNLAGDDPMAILADLRADAAAVVATANDPDAAIEIEALWGYPGLDAPESSEAVAFVRALTGANAPMKVAFGTEGGLYDQRLGAPVAICGPGSMNQGHKPDEFVAIEQLERCDAMLERLIARLETGL